MYRHLLFKLSGRNKKMKDRNNGSISYYFHMKGMKQNNNELYLTLVERNFAETNTNYIDLTLGIRNKHTERDVIEKLKITNISQDLNLYRKSTGEEKSSINFKLNNEHLSGITTETLVYEDGFNLIEELYQNEQALMDLFFNAMVTYLQYKPKEKDKYYLFNWLLGSLYYNLIYKKEKHTLEEVSLWVTKENGVEHIMVKMNNVQLNNFTLSYYFRNTESHQNILFGQRDNVLFIDKVDGKTKDLYTSLFFSKQFEKQNKNSRLLFLDFMDFVLS